MRVAVLVMGLLLWLIALVQVALVGGLSDAANDEATQTAAALGFLGLIIWLVAIGVVMPWPRLAMIAFGLSALVMFAGSGDFPDLVAWGIVALFLGFMAYIGSRQKRKKERHEAERDSMLAQLVQHQSATAINTARIPEPTAAATATCGSCGATIAAGQRFCPECGAAQVQVPAI